MMSKEAIRGILRLALGAYHTYFILYASIWDIKHPNYETYAGRWKTLTFITCMLNCWYFIGAFLQDALFCHVLPDSINKKIKSFLDSMFGAVVCPAALLVVGAFWGLYFFNRELIWPVHMDLLIPQTYGHMMHTLLGVIALVELAAFNHKFLTFNEGFALCMTYAGCYVSWLYYIRYAAGIWVYPLFYRLTKPWRKEMFLSGVVSFLLALYCIVYGLHSSIHGVKDLSTKGNAGNEKLKAKKVRKIE